MCVWRELLTKLLAAFSCLLQYRIHPDLVLRDFMDPTVMRDDHSLLQTDAVNQAAKPNEHRRPKTPWQ